MTEISSSMAPAGSLTPQQAEVRRMHGALIGELGRPPNRLELAQAMGMEPSSLKNDITAIRRVGISITFRPPGRMLGDFVDPEGAWARMEDPDHAFSLETAERRAIYLALERAGWNKRAAASLLRIGKTTLYRKLDMYGISRPSARPMWKKCRECRSFVRTRGEVCGACLCAHQEALGRKCEGAALFEASTADLVAELARRNGPACAEAAE